MKIVLVSLNPNLGGEWGGVIPQFDLQSWAKDWRQIHKIKQNGFVYGMFCS